MSGMTQDDAIKIVESIGDVLGLEKIKDRMGISYYAESENTVVRISDHSTYCQTWVDKGTYKKTNKYSVVIEVNPSKPNPIINIPVSEFSIKEFKHKLKKLDNNSVMNITNAIKGAIGPGGQFSNPEQVIPKTIISKYIPPKPSISKTNNKGTNKSNNMKKNIVKINENTIRQIVAESVKKVLKEGIGDFTDYNGVEFRKKLDSALSALEECVFYSKKIDFQTNEFFNHLYDELYDFMVSHQFMPDIAYSTDYDPDKRYDGDF